MEIKDMILSTISDLEQTLGDTKEMQKKFNTAIKTYSYASQNDESEFDLSEGEFIQKERAKEIASNADKEYSKEQISQAHENRKEDENIGATKIPTPTQTLDSRKENGRAEEIEFLNALRERILVLFEGLQSPNSRELEKKVDLLLNYLEYQLAHIEERLEKLEK